MASLSILCAICNEFFNTNAKIYSTHCGHLFHHGCLTRWLNRSATCPECRVSCNERRSHRVFLNYGERTAADIEWEAKIAEYPEPYWEYLDTPFEVGTSFEMPTDAIKSGTDADGNDVYVARAPFRHDLLPVNFVPALGGAHAPWGFSAHFLRDEIELLICKDYKWVAASSGQIPTDAIPVGYTSTGEKLYTARAIYNDILLPGKVHPSYKLMYMPYKRDEAFTSEYEVLVKISKETDAS